MTEILKLPVVLFKPGIVGKLILERLQSPHPFPKLKWLSFLEHRKLWIFFLFVNFSNSSNQSLALGLSTDEKALSFYKSAPGCVPTQTAVSQSRRFEKLDLDRAEGVIRSKEKAFSQDGGLAVLYGNLAEDGCIVKTAGVDEKILKFTGPAYVVESQDDAVNDILTGKVKSGDVVIIRHEGPLGWPG